MSTEFKPNDRVSINKDLTYTDKIFSAVKEMKSIFTGTVTHAHNDDDEVTVMLDYPDDVPESKRISYSYDPRDLTLVPTFKPKDKVLIDKNLTYTRPRFGTTTDMEKYFTGTVSSVYGKGNDARVYVKLNSNENNTVVGYYAYDPRDLTLIPNNSNDNDNDNEKKGNTMSKLNKGDRVTINTSLKYTRRRFGLTTEMKTIFIGVINCISENNKAIVSPDGSEWSYTYDLRDLTPITNNGFPIPTNVKTSNNKTTVEFSDNTTTSVTKSAGDPYDLETAIAYCIAKKLVTNSCIKRLAKNAEEVLDKVNTEFYNKFLKPYGFLNENAYTDVEIETLKDYLKTLNDVRAEMALVAIENNLTKDELFGKLKD